ncbi:carboxylesterase/lipase family protein [Sphingomonas glaciei]|uniref:Carboxylic ester hydrolase n=1 Tax=Sphingomonas glaciei TaxID=2938948 RepID=A0ABY5MUF5_9SPHN|nr:carboxylesterase family protein [Sphingomonas glaciei]UUR08120.1 carboxylesterase family protein [Sphingomonas glaciei]
MPPRPEIADTITSSTAAGTYRGVRVGTVECFFGVPYAASPVGRLRFAEPRPIQARQGERDAGAPGPTAPQRHNPFPALDVEPLIGTDQDAGEDYLTLNIWRPAGGGTALPVMVWIHGGGFVLGSKDAAVCNGSAFARDGVICIAINYRLGIEGFLPIPGVPTNLGLRDQIAALEWVRDNVASFGGDPGNVTVFGESAGGMAVANLLTSPLASGLFRRAIVQSGHGGMTRSIGVAQRLVRKVARLLGIKPDVESFRSVPIDRALDAQQKVGLPTTRIDLREADGREPVFGISRFVPVHGDDVLPEQPLAALQRGAGAEVELLIGTNAEEMNLYLVPTGVRDKIGRLLATYLVHRSQPQARKVLAAYGMGRPGKRAGHVLTAALNDLVFRWPARRFAEEHRGRTHLYEFEWRSPALGGELGACHGMELPFVFDTLASVTGERGLAGTAPPQALADRVHRIWIDFAKTGELPWPEFDRDTRQVYQLAKGEAVHEPAMPAAPFLP